MYCLWVWVDRRKVGKEIVLYGLSSEQPYKEQLDKLTGAMAVKLMMPATILANEYVFID